MFNHILISGTTTPSSTIAVLVFATPVSITHAFKIPAPYVAPMSQGKAYMEGSNARRGRARSRANFMMKVQSKRKTVKEWILYDIRQDDRPRCQSWHPQFGNDMYN